ncbi:MAG: hypothetical protein ACERIH_04765 [Labilibaculum antarcticum]
MEKITIKDLNQTCSDLKKQNEEIKDHFEGLKKVELGINKSSLGLLKNLLNSLETIKIPDEIKLHKIQKIDIADSTRKWLMYYFVCSFLVVILSLGFAFYSYQYEYKPKKELEISDKQNEWVLNYMEFMGQKNSKDHLKFMKKNPFPE